MSRKPPEIPSSMCQAALFYARRGWPVFPCRECDEIVDRGDGKRTFKAKAPYTSKGLKDATTDAHQIKLWWTRWPNAMIGLPMGVNGCFALDFDPRVDDDGEVFTLERLKAELEAQIGCELPTSLAARTPSDGVHVYLAQPEGEPIRNRGNLPRHVDVRGLGGYVIAPPSIIHPGTPQEARYRFLRGKWDAEVEQAPAALVDVLREVGKPRASAEAAELPRSRALPLPADLDEAARAAIRRYAIAALEAECDALRRTGEGGRNNQLNISALKIASLVAAGALGETIARASIEAAARECGLDESELQATLKSGWTAGLNQPRDLGEIAAAARERSARRARAGPHGSFRPRPPSSTANGTPSSQTGDSGGEGGAGKGAGDDQEAEDAGLARRCAFYPQTDLGNLERFLARYGGDFIYVEAWGWLAWDGQRWNRDMAMALLGHAVQKTMRAIQEEAAFIRESGVRDPDLVDEAGRVGNRSKQRELHLETGEREDALDYVVDVKGGRVVLFSDQLKKWGRTSEGAGHINCIAKLAEARLSALTEDFDADPLKLNVQNGTLVFLRPDMGMEAAVTLREHRREDRMTRIAKVVYDAKASSPKFDAFLEKVQPDAEMRGFLDAWAGYGALGLADAQKMCVFYGQGSNGKGVWITTIATILGDYAWKAAIETYIDQGRYRKGSDASPDLAALAGRRFVYANEPEDNSKFSDGLVKAMTSDEPLGGVRELNRPPFELLVTFNNTVLANNRPRIGTDHGIQRRMQIVPWDVIIPDEEQDLQLKSKLMGEASGILNRMVRGALAFLTGGLPTPEAIKAATREYIEENDILGQFLELCVKRVEGETTGATPLHRLFAAWQTWAQLLPQTGKPWSAKHLNGQMQRKGFRISKSSTMQWHDIALLYDELDFVSIDEHGKLIPKSGALPEPKQVGGDAPAPRPPDDEPVPGYDDDVP